MRFGDPPQPRRHGLPDQPRHDHDEADDHDGVLHDGAFDAGSLVAALDQ